MSQKNNMVDQSDFKHLSGNMFTLGTKLLHPTQDPVVELTEKVKHIENQKDYETLYRS